MKSRSPADPRGLIHESFRIDGITMAECRSIFLDWAMSLPEATDQRGALRDLIARHADRCEGHPMLAVLREGLAETEAPRRRGGRAARIDEG
ncbi:hypothetical protein E2L08_02120 [Palleronia sediminis]|uniref:Uncharacterized protein n=1 Tax=Palleronia sediminis TaxID=2547833 RepID=A0A4R6AQH4_9RHOB|nr:hypothetical protein [Palleronia sediminis]TDL84286.1 hypothetical protein E2L08_02120 [Palleronia sediminis]